MRLQDRKKLVEPREASGWVVLHFLSLSTQYIHHMATIGEHTNESSRNSSSKGSEPANQRWADEQSWALGLQLISSRDFSVSLVYSFPFLHLPSRMSYLNPRYPHFWLCSIDLHSFIYLVVHSLTSDVHATHKSLLTERNILHLFLGLGSHYLSIKIHLK